MDDEIDALRKEVRHLIAMNAASYVTITSLIAPTRTRSNFTFICWSRPD